MTPDQEYEDTRTDRVDGAHPFTKDAPVTTRQDTGDPLPETSDELQPETGDDVAWDTADETRPDTSDEDLRDTRDEGLRDTRDEVVPLDASDASDASGEPDDEVPGATGAGTVMSGEAEDLTPEDLTPRDEPNASPPSQQSAGVTELGPLFDPANASDFQQRWRAIQSEFVEDPQGSVRLAKDLTEEIVSSLTVALEDRRQTLDTSARNGDTEQLRLVLRQYRDVLEGVTSL